jgi:hypothetical protein
MKVLNVGPCPVCDKNIWNKKRLPLMQIVNSAIIFNFKKVPCSLNEDGRHFWILLTNGSRMRVAICNSCYEKLNASTVNGIMANIVYTHLQKMDNMNFETFNHFRTQEMFMWFGTEQEVIDYIKKVQNGKADRTE